MNKEEKNYARKIVLAKDTINMMMDNFFDEVTVKGNYKEGILEVNIKDFINEILDKKLKALLPYRFEDLKPNMWIWDAEDKRCIKIYELSKHTQHNWICYYAGRDYYGRFEDNILEVKFEENRFFPITDDRIN